MHKYRHKIRSANDATFSVQSFLNAKNLVARITLRVLGATTILFSADVVVAQRRPTTIPDEVSCAKCRIETVRTFVLGDTSGPGEMVQFPSTIDRDRQGRFWVIERGMPKVYSADGRFIKALGLAGGGPGEFRGATEVVNLPGDSTLVIDGPLARGTIYGPDLTMRRTLVFPVLTPRPAIVIKWPLIWGNGPISSSDAAGRTLHTMSLASDQAVVLRSFDPGDGQLRAGGFSAISQLLSPAQGNSVWTAYRRVYQLTHWDTEGNKLDQFVRTPKWFATQSSAWAGNPKTPPPPFVRAVYEDKDGLVWVYVSIPGPRWSDAWDRVRATPALEYPDSQIDTDKLWVTTVEVIDPRAKRVIARTTLDSFVAGVLADGTAWSQISDADGRRTVRFSQMRLTDGRQ